MTTTRDLILTPAPCHALAIVPSPTEDGKLEVHMYTNSREFGLYVGMTSDGLDGVLVESPDGTITVFDGPGVVLATEAC